MTRLSPFDQACVPHAPGSTQEMLREHRVRALFKDAVATVWTRCVPGQGTLWADANERRSGQRRPTSRTIRTPRLYPSNPIQFVCDPLLVKEINLACDEARTQEHEIVQEMHCQHQQESTQDGGRGRILGRTVSQIVGTHQCPFRLWCTTVLAFYPLDDGCSVLRCSRAMSEWRRWRG
jgi:hypothetical protein